MGRLAPRQGRGLVHHGALNFPGEGRGLGLGPSEGPVGEVGLPSSEDRHPGHHLNTCCDPLCIQPMDSIVGLILRSHPRLGVKEWGSSATSFSFKMDFFCSTFTA